MMSLKSIPHLHRPISSLSHSRLRSLCSRSRPSLPFSPRSAPPPPRSLSISAQMAPDPIVEHVVLFKVRDSTDPAKTTAMLSNLLALSSLPVVTHLAVAPILRPRSAAASSLGFTHLLHSRYASKDDLATYSAHPSHMAVVKENVLPICEDLMAVDWVGYLSGPTAVPPGSAVRLTFSKPAEGATAAGIVDAIAGAAGSAPAGVDQVTFGENISPARAKGYEVAMIAVFPGLKEMDEVDGGGVTEALKEKVRPLLDSVLVVDFVAPASPAASL